MPGCRSPAPGAAICSPSSVWSSLQPDARERPDGGTCFPSVCGKSASVCLEQVLNPGPVYTCSSFGPWLEEGHPVHCRVSGHPWLPPTGYQSHPAQLGTWKMSLGLAKGPWEGEAKSCPVENFSRKFCWKERPSHFSGRRISFVFTKEEIDHDAVAGTSASPWGFLQCSVDTHLLLSLFIYHVACSIFLSPLANCVQC